MPSTTRRSTSRKRIVVIRKKRNKDGSISVSKERMPIGSTLS